MKFTVRNTPCLPYMTRIPGVIFRTPGEVHETLNSEITLGDLARWHQAGIIDIDQLQKPEEYKLDPHVIVSPANIDTLMGA